MARGAGEPSAKRAKKDKEDPLVRRRNELILGVANARAEGMRLVREAEEEAERLKREAEEKAERLKRGAEEKAERLKREAEEYLAKHIPSVCADLEDENRNELLGKLPLELWEKIVDEYVQQNDLLALAMTCRFFRDTTKGLSRKLETNLKLESGKVKSHSLGWFRWVCDTFEIPPGFQHGVRERVEGAVYEGDLVNYAAFQGSVEILRWLVEEKGWELNRETDWFVGQGGSVEVMEYLVDRGHEFTSGAGCGVAKGGHLEALKFLRGLDPPCPWYDNTCCWAAREGHLEILKWLRDEDPPCPWSKSQIRWEASYQGHQHVIDWIDQREDESDVEYSDDDISDW